LGRVHTEAERRHGSQSRPLRSVSDSAGGRGDPDGWGPLVSDSGWDGGVCARAAVLRLLLGRGLGRAAQEAERERGRRSWAEGEASPREREKLFLFFFF